MWMIRLVGVLSLAFLSVPQRLWSIEIRDVLVRRLGEDDFPRLVSHSKAATNTNRRGMFRTEPSSATGLYFMAFFDQSLRRFPEGLSAVLEYYLPSDARCHRHTFPLSDLILGQRARRHRELWIGLTGSTTADLRSTDCLAWRLSLVDRNGNIVTRKSSFLFCERATP